MLEYITPKKKTVYKRLHIKTDYVSCCHKLIILASLCFIQITSVNKVYKKFPNKKHIKISFNVNFLYFYDVYLIYFKLLI